MHIHVNLIYINFKSYVLWLNIRIAFEDLKYYNNRGLRQIRSVAVTDYYSFLGLKGPQKDFDD